MEKSKERRTDKLLYYIVIPSLVSQRRKIAWIKRIFQTKNKYVTI
jgi:hypothetical protein